MEFELSSGISRCAWRRSARGVVLCLLALFSAPVLAQDCVDDLTGVTNNCTANDVSLGLIFVTEEETVFCEPGEVIEVPLRASIVAGSQVRYDIGMFIAEDGGDARSGQCFHDFIQPVIGKTCGGPVDIGTAEAGGLCFRDQEVADGADICGDVIAGEDNFYDLNGGAPVSLTCTPNPDDPTQVIVSHVVSWDNTSNNTCAGIVDAVPNTKAKCSSGFSVVGGIEIIVDPTISITKTAESDVINIGGTATYDIVVTNTTEPNGDTDLLNLVVSDDTCDAAPVLDSCTAGSPAALPAGESCTYTCSVDEAQVDFCNTATVVANPESAPETEVTTQATECVEVVGGEIVVGKETLPDGATDIFEFLVVGPGFDNTGDEEELQDGQTFSTGIIAPGEYTVTESSLPAGWALTDVSCDTDTSGEGNSRTFTLAVDQVVTCTFTNTQHGSLTIEKVCINTSEGEFNFLASGDGLEDFGLVCADSTTFENLVPGAGRSVEEIVPPDFELEASCDDASPTSNIDIGPGESVTCTFTNTLAEESVAIPVMDQRGLAALALLLMGFAGWVLYRRRTGQLS